MVLFFWFFLNKFISPLVEAKLCQDKFDKIYFANARSEMEKKNFFTHFTIPNGEMRETKKFIDS